MPGVHMVKTSVFLKSETHKKIKIMAAENGTSIQKLMEQEAQKIIDAADGKPTEEEPLTKRQIQTYMESVERILQSKDRLAILVCCVSIESSERMIQQRTRGPA
jgi:hypothetical protein